MSLLDYQLPHAQQLIRALEREGSTAVDASDTGTGKTYSAAHVAKAMGLRPLVICPKAVTLTWKRVLDTFELKYLGISNYEMFKGLKWFSYTENVSSMGTLEPCPYVYQELGKKDIFWSPDLPQDCLIIFDEAHRCKNHKTGNSRLLLSTKPLPVRKLLLSATLADRGEFFAPFAVMFGFCDTIEEYRLFKRRLEIGPASSINQYIRNQENAFMSQVHNRIFPDHGSRIRIRELGDKFPKNQIIADTYMMDDDTVKGIRDAYDSIRAISIQAEARQLMATCTLVEIIRARQKVEALKVRSMVDLAVGSIEAGNSVAVFVNFLDTMDLIIEGMKAAGHPVKLVIKGGQSISERQAIIDRFQEDSEVIILCQIQSGGVGISLHDTNGARPRVSIISPSWSAQDLMQSLGRIHRAGGKTVCIQKLVYCHGTVEERICRAINKKLVNYHQFNDGGNSNPAPRATPVAVPTTVSEIPNEELCVVCLANRKTHLFLHENGSEGHFCCCMTCADTITSDSNVCPVCRQAVRECVRCY